MNINDIYNEEFKDKDMNSNEPKDSFMEKYGDNNEFIYDGEVNNNFENYDEGYDNYNNYEEDYEEDYNGKMHNDQYMSECRIKDDCNIDNDKIYDEYTDQYEIEDRDNIEDKDMNDDEIHHKNYDNYKSGDESHDTNCDDHKGDAESHDKSMNDYDHDEADEDDIEDEYMYVDEILSKLMKDNKKNDKCLKPEDSKISVNCRLKVDFDTENKIIYLYPGRTQYFTVNALKCCGDVTIKYKGNYTSKGICGKLAIYKIVDSGIFVEAYPKLDPRKTDFLKFTAIDECTNESYDFVVVFGYNPCRGCY